MTAPAHRAAPQLPGNAPELDAPNGAPSLDAVLDMTDYLKSISNPKALENQKDLIAAYDKAVNALVGPNDIQKAKKKDRDGKVREFKKKSAWKKLARHFRIDVQEKSHNVVRTEDGNTIAEVIMTGIAPWGQRVDEIGACTTYEERFKYDKSKGWHDCLATAQTRASNRAISALIAAGEVSAEEAEAQQERDEKADASFPFGPQQGMAVNDGAIGLGLLVKAIHWCMKDDDRMARFEDFVGEAWKALPSKIQACPDDELLTIAKWASAPSREEAFGALAKECADAIHARGLDHAPKDATTGTALEGQKDEEAAQLEAKLTPNAVPEGNAPAPAASSGSPAAAGAHAPSTTPIAPAKTTASSVPTPSASTTTDQLAARRAQLKARVSHPACATIRTIVEARLSELTEAEIDDQMTMAADIIHAWNVSEGKKEQGRKGMAARKANEAKRAGAESEDAGASDDDPFNDGLDAMGNPR